MINIANERLLTINEAAKRVPGRKPGKCVHVHTVFRWTTRGCGGRVLESVRIGGRRYTSEEALARFSPGSEAPRVIPGRGSSAEQGRGVAAQAVLREAGIAASEGDDAEGEA